MLEEIMVLQINIFIIKQLIVGATKIKCGLTYWFIRCIRQLSKISDVFFHEIWGKNMH